VLFQYTAIPTLLSVTRERQVTTNLQNWPISIQLQKKVNYYSKAIKYVYSSQEFEGHCEIEGGSKEMAVMVD